MIFRGTFDKICWYNASSRIMGALLVRYRWHWMLINDTGHPIVESPIYLRTVCAYANNPPAASASFQICCSPGHRGPSKSESSSIFANCPRRNCSTSARASSESTRISSFSSAGTTSGKEGGNVGPGVAGNEPY
jgi:hypothetical protein